MLYNDDKEIVEYLLSKYPEEGCGIIQNRKGKLRWIPSTNVAENPEEYFKINEEDYLRATLTGDIHAIVHSHPNASAELSEADKKASDHLGVPYIVYSIPEGEKVEYIPERKTLIGRDYVFGENDCYTLARDYYKQELNLDLPVQDFEDDWWDLGLNYFDDLFDKHLCVELYLQILQKLHLLVLMRLKQKFFHDQRDP